MLLLLVLQPHGLRAVSHAAWLRAMTLSSGEALWWVV